MFNWQMVVQSNLDYPDFSIIRTRFCGSSFSWILFCHIMCPQQKFFPSNYVLKLRFELNLFRFRKHKSGSISRHNWYTAFHRALIGSDLLFAEGNFTYSSQLLTCSWLINIHIFDYLHSQLSGPSSSSSSSSVGCRADDYNLLPTTTALCQLRQLVLANHVVCVSQ